MAPMLGAVLMSPSPSDRSASGRWRAAAFTAAGVLTDSAAASAMRAATNCPMVAATACAIPARLHAATAVPYARRTPTRSTSHPAPSSTTAVVT